MERSIIASDPRVTRFPIDWGDGLLDGCPEPEQKEEDNECDVLEITEARSSERDDDQDAEDEQEVDGDVEEDLDEDDDDDSIEDDEDVEDAEEDVGEATGAEPMDAEPIRNDTSVSTGQTPRSPSIPNANLSQLGPI